MIDNSKNPKLTEVFKSTNGTKFYSYIDPLQISAFRGLAADKAKRFLEMNLTERSLRSLIDEYKIAAKENDVNKFHSIVYEIGYRLDFLSEETSILDLSCIYFFLQDEDPELPSESHNKRKHEIFLNDTKAKGFFLQIGLSLCKKFSPKQESDMLDYLETPEIKNLSERIRRFIANEHQISLTNTSTS